jgi:hypothetical protein
MVVMAWMCPDSECAATIYQHGSHGADQAITDVIDRYAIEV